MAKRRLARWCGMPKLRLIISASLRPLAVNLRQPPSEPGPLTLLAEPECLPHQEHDPVRIWHADLGAAGLASRNTSDGWRLRFDARCGDPRGWLCLARPRHMLSALGDPMARPSTETHWAARLRRAWPSAVLKSWDSTVTCTRLSSHHRGCLAARPGNEGTRHGVMPGLCRTPAGHRAA